MPQIQEQIVAVVVLAGDVPVIMQLEYQQSKFENPEVPQFLFVDRVLDIPVATQRRVRAVQNCAENRQDSTGAVLWEVFDAPVVVQRQVLGGSDSAENLWRCRSCSLSTWGRDAVTMQRQVPAVFGTWRFLRSAHRQDAEGLSGLRPFGRWFPAFSGLFGEHSIKFLTVQNLE